jgi:hypothetical protein
MAETDFLVHHYIISEDCKSHIIVSTQQASMAKHRKAAKSDAEAEVVPQPYLTIVELSVSPTHAHMHSECVDYLRMWCSCRKGAGGACEHIGMALQRQRHLWNPLRGTQRPSTIDACGWKPARVQPSELYRTERDAPICERTFKRIEQHRTEKAFRTCREGASSGRMYEFYLPDDMKLFDRISIESCVPRLFPQIERDNGSSEFYVPTTTHVARTDDRNICDTCECVYGGDLHFCWASVESATREEVQDARDGRLSLSCGFSSDYVVHETWLCRCSTGFALSCGEHNNCLRVVDGVSYCPCCDGCIRLAFVEKPPLTTAQWKGREHKLLASIPGTTQFRARVGALAGLGLVTSIVVGSMRPYLEHTVGHTEHFDAEFHALSRTSMRAEECKLAKATALLVEEATAKTRARAALVRGMGCAGQTTELQRLLLDLEDASEEAVAGLDLGGLSLDLGVDPTDGEWFVVQRRPVPFAVLRDGVLV